jgi:hypothetical protein
MKSLPSQEYLNSVLSYCPDNGRVTRLVKKGPGNKGTEAGHECKNGYRVIVLDGTAYKTHRLIWVMFYGSAPHGEIDHIDGCRSNNRIQNLRDIAKKLNGQNQRLPQKHNQSGFLGVHLNGNRYRAVIRVDGKLNHLGYFSDAASAHAAYLLAKRELHEGCTV